MTRGRFITFEGGEGTGKSTQVGLLARRLKTLGVNALVTREPGGAPGAEAVRHVLLSGAAKPLGPYAETILFAAARDDHVRTTIRPTIESGRWVLCDRFADSTRIYQGSLGNVDARLIRALERITIGDLKPDLTLILDVSAEIGLARAAARRGTREADRFETEALDYHQRLRQAFRELADAESERCVLIDAGADLNKVADSVWKTVEARLDPASAPLLIEDLA